MLYIFDIKCLFRMKLGSNDNLSEFEIKFKSCKRLKNLNIIQSINM
jgi:hypothetical protein